ncbi:hypothetical protein OAR74_01100 [Gammaproteobacteria bacterium]|nr:hypothetical protein [Gammaproteobacteria bacterium]MDC0990396.1 hypothetical protein [Gammaproteobacteria bacterium]MDC3306367.1 hypothetical protein [Gammaproteobacteria bacterium]
MKKLLALLLLSPLASAYWSEITNTLDLENLSQWFPNDSYIGLTCTNSNYRPMSYRSKADYKMMVFSLEELKGINLMFYRHTNYQRDFDNIDPNSSYIYNWDSYAYFTMYKNEKWGKLTVKDYSIQIDSPGSNTIDREKLRLNDETYCNIATEEEMKEFGYRVEKLYQKHRKIVDDNIENRLKKRKL